MNTSSSSSCLNKFDWISNYGPSFVLPASSLDVLYEPSDFFKELNKIFANAKDRIYISSLYFGTDPYGYELVDIICQKNLQAISDCSLSLID
jgi:phosphatidylserine/phosphatidylglycerophosphate/cardiolipin synthase-like enzyme